MGPCICTVTRPRNARRRLAMKRGTMACLACSSYSWMSTASHIPTTFSTISPSFHHRHCRRRRAHPRPTTSGQLFANQFIELHLRHTLAHPPDNVLFPKHSFLLPLPLPQPQPPTSGSPATICTPTRGSCQRSQTIVV